MPVTFESPQLVSPWTLAGASLTSEGTSPALNADGTVDLTKLVGVDADEQLVAVMAFAMLKDGEELKALMEDMDDNMDGLVPLNAALAEVASWTPLDWKNLPGVDTSQAYSKELEWARRTGLMIDAGIDVSTPPTNAPKAIFNYIAPFTFDPVTNNIANWPPQAWPDGLEPMGDHTQATGWGLVDGALYQHPNGNVYVYSSSGYGDYLIRTTPKPYYTEVTTEQLTGWQQAVQRGIDRVTQVSQDMQAFMQKLTVNISTKHDTASNWLQRLEEKIKEILANIAGH
jgi:hypothetical protein